MNFALCAALHQENIDLTEPGNSGNVLFKKPKCFWNLTGNLNEGIMPPGQMFSSVTLLVSSSSTIDQVDATFFKTHPI